MVIPANGFWYFVARAKDYLNRSVVIPIPFDYVAEGVNYLQAQCTARSSFYRSVCKKVVPHQHTHDCLYYNDLGGLRKTWKNAARLRGFFGGLLKAINVLGWKIQKRSRCKSGCKVLCGFWVLWPFKFVLKYFGHDQWGEVDPWFT